VNEPRERRLCVSDAKVDCAGIGLERPDEFALARAGWTDEHGNRRGCRAGEPAVKPRSGNTFERSARRDRLSVEQHHAFSVLGVSELLELGTEWLLLSSVDRLQSNISVAPSR